MEKLHSERERLSSISSYWSSTTGINAHFVTYSYKALRPFFRGKTCLELGSADGQMTQYLVQDFSKVVAVDGSEKFIDDLKKKDIANLIPVCSLFEEFEYSEKFDTVIMAHILEHVDNPVEIISIGKKFLKQDGVLLIDVPNAKSFHRLAAVEMGLLKAIDELNETDNLLGHRRVYTSELMRDHIKQAGLKPVHWGGHFLKTVSNKQMEESWNQQMMDAYFEVGKRFPDNCAEIYFVCETDTNS